MVTGSIIKYLLCDDVSLSSYFEGNIVSFEDIKRRLLLLQRMNNRFVADHYYRLNQEKSFDGIKNSAQILDIGLFRIAEEHLELRMNRIHVRQEKQNDWQELITRIPPLVLQAVYLQKKIPKLESAQKYFNDIILPNARYTALPYPYIVQIEDYIKNKNGFHDLHMHLNGSTETDIAWQDFLKWPDKIYKDLQDGFKNGLVKEQFEQESHLTDPIKFRNLILIARRIRNYLFIMLYPDALSSGEINRLKAEISDEKKFPNESVKRLSKIKSEAELLKAIVDLDSTFFDGLENPFADFISNGEMTDNYPMAVECLMYVTIFQYLSESPKEIVAILFHFYLLILGLANRLLVQQTHQYGFEQFQKHTVNELRTKSERIYENRFLQLHGNELRNIRFLEGRFSPKNNEIENLILIQNILKGWENLKNIIIQKEKPQLKLIAHFIKVKEKTPYRQFRHMTLRESIWLKACVLAYMKDQNSQYIKEVIGIDSASSEFDAPPEVFAPSYRLLRKRGFQHFTYHAGEDFFHIVSGLRAIYEAIEFTEMKNGDRIGHAVASGIDAKIWINNVGKIILIRQGEHLDNLLFAYHLIVKERIESLKPILPLLTNDISELSFNIYQEFYSIEILLEAWQLRKFCPMLLLSDSKESAEPYSVYSDYEWSEIERQIPNRKNDRRIKLLQKYHDINHRKAYETIIEIEALRFFDIFSIKELQLALLKYMHKKEIVIETLPTSNVRIGQHHNYQTYHLWNWIKWEQDGHCIPPIVIGTDDTGIFATNIYNEFANIYCYLTYYGGMNHDKAMGLIRKLDKNASAYKFD